LQNTKTDTGRLRDRYNEIDMTTPAAMTELTMNNVFTMSVPVLQIQDRFYTTENIYNCNTIDYKKGRIYIPRMNKLTTQNIIEIHDDIIVWKDMEEK
jgi:hypothetical protein